MSRPRDGHAVTGPDLFGITTIVISHDMVSTFRTAHTIAMIDIATIAICGAPAEVAASREAYVHRPLDASALE